VKFENIGEYIVWPGIRLEGLPNSVIVNDKKLVLKEELHITLVMARRLAPLVNGVNSETIQNEIIKMFDDFASKNILKTYELTNELRLVERDGKMTVIVMVKVPGLEVFFDELREKYHVDLPLQPTHITLYSLSPEVGISILSDEVLQHESKPVNIPELQSLLDS
jgi:hypothetical protein